jgi:hypothetical protein
VIAAPLRATFLLLWAVLLSQTAWAQRLSYYETRSIVLSSEGVAAQATESYWKSRLVRQTQLTLIQRADATPVGLDPLFAAISTWLPQSSSDVSDWVFVLRDPAGTGARATLRPAGQHPEMDLQPFEVDAVSTVQANEPTPDDWRPSGSFRHAGFPGGLETYCEARPGVCAALFASGAERQNTLLTIEAPGSDASFLVDRRSDAVQGALLVRYLGEVGVTPLSAPADFAQRDIADLSLDAESGGARIAVTGIEALTQRERIAVKNTIVGYLQSGTRSAEADVVLPAGPAGERMLYTLRFVAERGEVTVESLGSAADLLPADGPRSDVRHIPGYPSGGNRSRVLEWLRKRYPALSVQGRTVDEVATNADRAVERQSTTMQWFEANYRLAVLEAKSADRRLASVHGRASQERGGLREFDATELRALEAVLQRIGERGLALLRGTAFVRQRATGEASPFGDPGNQVQVAGHTFTRATQTQPGNPQPQVEATVVIYDAAHAPNRFIGGHRPEGFLRAYPPVAQVLAHELGHVMSQRAPVQREFDALVSATGAHPFTRYAASNPESEFFPEAVALYLLDPAWVNDNYPELYARIQAYLKRPRPSGL